MVIMMMILLAHLEAERQQHNLALEAVDEDVALEDDLQPDKKS